MNQLFPVIFLLTKLLLLSNCQNDSYSNTDQPQLEKWAEEDFDYLEEEDQIMNRTWRSGFFLDDPEEKEVEHLFFYEIDGTRRSTGEVFGHFSRLNNSYLVLAPIIARPNSVYRIVFLPYRVEEKSALIDFAVTISSHNEEEITFASARGLVGETTEVLLKLPGALDGPHLRLRVEGTQGSEVLFTNTTLIHPSNDFLTIVVQMSRPLFNGNQQVDFRIILLQTTMLPYQEPVDVYILDSTGYVVRRWVSRMPNTGVIDLSFRTPPLPAGGYWRVRVQAGTQRKDHPFLVVKYFIPRFEIMWDMPSYALATDSEIAGEVQSIVTNDANAYGNLTLTAFAKHPWSAPDTDFKPLDFKIQDYIPGSYEFSVPMGLLEGIVPKLAGTEIKIEAKVTDSFTGMTVGGYSRTRIISGDVSISFVGPSSVVFRPGMPKSFVVNVAYEDDESIDPEILSGSYLRITATANLRSGGSRSIKEVYIPPEGGETEAAEAFMDINEIDYNENFTIDADRELWLDRLRFESTLVKETYIMRNRFNDYRQTGVFSFSLEIPDDAATISVTATYRDSEGNSAADEIQGVANYSPKDRHLHITTSTTTGLVGQFAVFHIRSNFPLTKFHYLIMSKGLMIHSSTERVAFSGAEGVATIDLALSKEMYPVLTFVAFYVDDNGDIIADSIKLPVQTFHTLEADIFQYKYKDPSKKTVETFLAAIPGSYVAMSTARQVSYTKQPRNRLTEGRFVQESLMMEPFPRTVAKVQRTPRNSPDPATIWIYSSNDAGGDALRTLQEAALAPLSDRRFTATSLSVGHCEISLGFLECGDGSCFRFKDVCNGVIDCEDGIDEELCDYEHYPDVSHKQGISEAEEYLLLRVNLWKDFFDVDDGGWAWLSLFVGHGGDEAASLEVPKTQDTWLIEGFATHNELGFTLIPPFEYISDPPFFLVLEGPSICRRGEQVSIRTAIFNSKDKDLIALVILPASDDYEFVHVEENGVVDGYKPRTSPGEHHHLIFVKAGDIKEVFMPLAIKKQRGTLVVTIQLVSQVAFDEESMEIEIRAEGAEVRMHTSALLDLKSRALFYEFMDLPLDESPLITNTLSRRFIYGSPKAELTLSGDVFGPITEKKSVTFLNAFGGRYIKSNDGLAFNFGATIWTLHYLRLTNQLVVTEAIDTFNFLNVQLAGMLTRFVRGGFKMWHYSTPSVWLTAWTVSQLSAALLEDWENYIFIDPRIIIDSVVFMLSHQNPNGYFYETEIYNITLDHKHRYKFQNHAENVTVGLTALVTSSIKSVIPVLPGEVRSAALQALWKSRRFLEMSLKTLDDPYDIAITSWALTLTGSAERDVAVSILLNHARPQDGFLYWSKEPITTNARVFENNQRTFLLPKNPQEYDASAVEATSYALMTLLSREGVTLRQERIVSWLVAVRDWDQAFVSTVDTVVAMKALTEYCYRARLRDVTDLRVDVQSSSSTDFEAEIKIEGPFVSALKTLEIPNPWGHLLLTGRGSGQAIAQLTMTWGVDVPRFYTRRANRDYFSLVIKQFAHQERNMSRITTTICASWLAEDFSPTSHGTMLEIEMPTGYYLYQPEANGVVKRVMASTFPQLFDVKVTERSIYFQFSHVPPTVQCFKYDVHRWHPVANHTFVRSAMIYELFTPEHFKQIMVNSSDIGNLDICEVCGSFQCPYCFYYSHASSSIQAPICILIFLTLISLAPILKSSGDVLIQCYYSHNKLKII